MRFTEAQLLARLQQLPPASRYWIAFSGGCDSTVLLHALAKLRPQLPSTRLAAVHVNHNLQDQAADWAGHCRAVCEALDIPLREISVDASTPRGHSPEAAARAARYEAFEGVLKAGDGLLLAHHQDDQAETLLLQLFRGSGPRGLAAMPAQRPFGAGWLGRPLLDFRRETLCAYARQRDLAWIDDPSNFDTGSERNFLRQELWPALQARWPALSSTLARAANHQAGAAALLEELAAGDWERLRPATGNNLPVKALTTLTPERQRNLLRYWIETVHGRPLPDRQRLERIRTELVGARPDANPELRWPGAMLRRYDGQLWLDDGGDLPASNPGRVMTWDLLRPLELGDGRRLETRPAPRGLDPRWRDHDNITVRFRHGGEICRPAGRAHHHPLKKLFQEWRVPPWQRSEVPLIYVGEDLAMVVGYCVCEPFQAQGEGLVVHEVKEIRV